MKQKRNDDCVTETYNARNIGHFDITHRRQSDFAFFAENFSNSAASTF